VYVTMLIGILRILRILRIVRIVRMRKRQESKTPEEVTDPSGCQQPRSNGFHHDNKGQ
jgi:hypothetical protein